MASPDVDSPWLCSASEFFGGCFNIQMEEVKSSNNVNVLEAPTSFVSDARYIPKPPPYPSTTSTTTSHCKRISASCSVPKETKDTWDRLFKEEYGSDVYIITDSNSYIPVHCNVLILHHPYLGVSCNSQKLKMELDTSAFLVYLVKLSMCSFVLVYSSCECDAFSLNASCYILYETDSNGNVSLSAFSLF
uniref:BTB domain-containing protein n=1 Tax=Salix viminalis TaxID=40686 RepID=A0A6N2LI25_SALVM